MEELLVVDARAVGYRYVSFDLVFVDEEGNVIASRNNITLHVNEIESKLTEAWYLEAASLEEERGNGQD